MSKTPKSDQLRALREANYERAQQERSQPSKIVEGLRQAVEHAQGKRECKTTAIVVKHGRPRKTEAGFDKTAYQRDYMRKRRTAAKEPT